MSEKFVIDPSESSFSAILADLVAFREAAPDEEVWRDFFASATGAFVEEQIAGLGTFLDFKTIVARREAFLQFARNRSSVIAAGQTLGYSAFRGNNQVLKLTVTPNFSGKLDKFNIVGQVKDQDLILKEDAIVNNGVSTEIEVTIGSLSTESVVVQGGGPRTFRLTGSPVSADARLFLNDVLVNTSERIFDLINENFLIQTNPFSSVDIKYLNQTNFDIIIGTGDVLKLEYIELKDLEFESTDLEFDHGVITADETVSLFKPVESIESIKTNAPIANETQFIIRGREDFKKIFKALDTSLIDTNQKDLTPATVQLTYVTTCLSLLNQVRKDELILEIIRPLGIPPPIISDPTPNFMSLDINVTLKSNQSGNIDTEVRDILSPLEKTLEAIADFDDIEEDVEELSFVKIARVFFTTPERTDSTLYRRGDAVVTVVPPPINIVFRLVRIVRFSGGVEPTFPVTLGDTVIDNGIVWEAIDINPCITVPDDWAASTDYVLNDLVKPTTPNGFHYKAVDFINLSNSSEEFQKLTFDSVPVGGTFRIEYDNSEFGGTDEVTSTLAFNASNVDVQNALNGLSQLSGVVVTGDFTSGFDIVFKGADANRDHPILKFTSIGLDEIQCLLPSDIPTTGTWKLTFLANETTAINFNDAAGVIQTRLEALGSIGAGNIEVTGDFNSKFLVKFIGTLSKQDHPDITVSQNSLSLANNVTATPSTTVVGVVVDAGANEIQDINFTLTPDGGNWSINFNGKTTALLAHDISSANLQTALEALDTITAGEVSVTGTVTTGFSVEFTGALALSDQPEITLIDNDLFKDQAVSVTPSTIQNGGGGFNETQKIDFSFVPAKGDWRINYGGLDTVILSFATTATSVQTALEALANIGVGNIEVSGDYENGFVLTFINGLADFDAAQVTIPLNTLKREQSVGITVITTQPGKPADAGTDEIQRIDFSSTPDANSFQIDFNGEQTTVLSSTATNVTVQNAMNALPSLSGVIVTGDFTNGFVISYAGADGKTNQPEITTFNVSLTNSTAPVTFQSCPDAQDGEVPANDLGVAVTVAIITDGSDPEPLWPDSEACP